MHIVLAFVFFLVALVIFATISIVAIFVLVLGMLIALEGFGNLSEKNWRVLGGAIKIVIGVYFMNEGLSILTSLLPQIAEIFKFF
jgi:hypothetical protein